MSVPHRRALRAFPIVLFAIVLTGACTAGGGPADDSRHGEDAGEAPPRDTTVTETGGDTRLGDDSDVGGSPNGLKTTCSRPDDSDVTGPWEVLCNGDRVGQLIGVWGAGPDDVYMVGGRTSSGGRPGKTRIFHWNGETLEAVANPGGERAWWVFGTDADHVYVFGENGLGLKRVDGGDFERIETGTDQTIFGAWGPSPDRIYFVSGNFRDPEARGRLHVLTPEGAREVTAPAIESYEGKALFKIWGTGRDEVFASGAKGALFHRDGDGWSRMTTPSEKPPILTVSGRANDDVYAVGGVTKPVAWHWDGEGWSTAASAPEDPRLMGVHTGPDLPVLVSGANGFLATLGSDGFQRIEPMTHYPLHAVWQDGEGGAWAVGGNIFATSGAARGVIVRRPGDSPCPPGGIEEPGYHHLDIQGREAEPREDGTYPMFDVSRGTIHPDLEHGEHFLLNAGSFVEFTVPLCADISDEVGFRITNNDDPTSRAVHELFVVRDGREMRVAKAVDTQSGNQGYIPFDRSSLPEKEEQAIAETRTHPKKNEKGWKDFADAKDFSNAPRDLLARPGDTLLYRATSLDNELYGVMSWYPQKQGLSYQTFIEVHVPETPGGQTGSQREPPPEPGECAERTEKQFVELGRDEQGFAPFPPAEILLERGAQGSLMFRLAVRGRGFAPGDPDDPLSAKNPHLIIRMALDAPPDEGGNIVADGSWRRGFEQVGEDYVLTGLQPTVPTDAAERKELLGETIYTEVTLVDATDGTTLCQQARPTAVAPE